MRRRGDKGDDMTSTVVLCKSQKQFCEEIKGRHACPDSVQIEKLWPHERCSAESHRVKVHYDTYFSIWRNLRNFNAKALEVGCRHFSCTHRYTTLMPQVQSEDQVQKNDSGSPAGAKQEDRKPDNKAKGSNHSAHVSRSKDPLKVLTRRWKQANRPASASNGSAFGRVPTGTVGEREGDS